DVGFSLKSLTTARSRVADGRLVGQNQNVVFGVQVSSVNGLRVNNFIWELELLENESQPARVDRPAVLIPDCNSWGGEKSQPGRVNGNIDRYELQTLCSGKISDYLVRSRSAADEKHSW